MSRTRASHPTEVAALLSEAFIAAARDATARALAADVVPTGEAPRSAKAAAPPETAKKAPAKTAKKAPAPRRPTKRPAAAKAVRK